MRKILDLGMDQTPVSQWLNGGKMMMLLHYSMCGDEYRGPGNSDHHAECLRGLRKLELMHEYGYDLTERGRHLVGFWKACPLPQLRWSDPRTNKALKGPGEGEAHAGMFNVGSS